ncbi:hypothetical protein [Kushneria phosphatilytica]|uniref:Uncharacterized protein n=1 Tax=Kushneria phosphatilytica TaxID=657387 RepID=A0A1S1NPF2_9GAMM|nr:hypothetical protein [Kushneria phosphatilytica]OHV09953.1 hypothetical protein BH688_10065 [Kushneria phosphatilytica]QEL11631.1 hypothetical protein FY550_11135 [Kushneria phosphatilytica]
MFLDNRQAAIDGLLEALADSLDYFQDNAARLPGHLREQFGPVFEERREEVRKLQKLARRHLKLLPRDADVERDDYLWLWSRLKSFVGNDVQVLIRELLEQERVLMQALSNAFTHPLPEDMEAVMEQLWRNCRRMIQLLYRHQERHQKRR